MQKGDNVEPYACVSFVADLLLPLGDVPTLQEKKNLNGACTHTAIKLFLVCAPPPFTLRRSSLLSLLEPHFLPFLTTFFFVTFLTHHGVKFSEQNQYREYMDR